MSDCRISVALIGVLLLLASAVVGQASPEALQYYRPMRLLGQWRYAVQMDTAGVWLDDDVYFFKYYVLEFQSDRDDSPYQIIDSIITRSNVAGCDTNAVAYTVSDDDCCLMVVRRFSGSPRLDTLARICDTFDPDFESPCYPKYSMFMLSLVDSICLFRQIVGFSDAMEVHNRVTLLRIDTFDRFDTLAEIDGVGGAVFSVDRSQLLMTVYAPSDTGSFSGFTIAIYDIPGDSLFYPLQEGHMGRRFSRDSPLYFRRRDNVWKLDEFEGEVQVTHFSPPQAVMDFYVMADSLMCKVYTFGPQDTTWVVQTIGIE